MGFYSKISNVALRIGGQTLEVDEDGQFVDGSAVSASSLSMLGGRPVTVEDESYGVQRFRVKLEPDEGMLLNESWMND